MQGAIFTNITFNQSKTEEQKKLDTDKVSPEQVFESKIEVPYNATSRMLCTSDKNIVPILQTGILM